MQNHPESVGRIIENAINPGSVLREAPDSYNAQFESETGVLRQNNSLFWNVSFENSGD